MLFKVKPSKPMAIFGAVFGVVILVVGIASMHRFSAFVILWIVAGIAIVAFNLWAAFSPRGSLYSVRGPDDDARRDRDN